MSVKTSGPARPVKKAVLIPGRAATPDERAPSWTFLTNHAHVMVLLSQDPSIILREAAGRIGITERAVQRIIAELEEAGYIEKHKVGRRNEYRIFAGQSLRHPIEHHRKIGDILDLIGDRR